jgi:hypothetical protein
MFGEEPLFTSRLVVEGSDCCDFASDLLRDGRRDVVRLTPQVDGCEECGERS